MIARSIIAMKDGDEFRSIYCHFDGYPDHHLPILKENYNTDEKVKELIDLGDLSILDKDLASCKFYHRDLKQVYEATKVITFNKYDYDKLISYAKINGKYLYYWDEEKWLLLDL